MFSEEEVATGITHVVLCGELTIYQAGELKQRFDKYTADGNCHTLIVEMEQVSEIDTACLQVLVQLKHALANSKRSLKIARPAAAVAEVMELCRLKPFFTEPAREMNQGANA